MLRGVTATVSLASGQPDLKGGDAGRPTAGHSSALAAASEEAATLKSFTVAVFSAQQYVLDFLQGPLAEVGFGQIKYIEARLKLETAPLAAGCDAVCLFVNDRVSEEVLEVLARGGTKFIAMRCAGFDKVDVAAAARHGIRIVRVPAYSPRSVAEHALALTFALARNLHLSHQRVQAGNYTLSGLTGFEVSGKTVGVIGTGKIGLALIKLLKGFDCKVLAHDVYQCPEALALGTEYVSMEQLLQESDIVSLHTPLMPSTFHLINKDRLALMKPGAVLINVSRGGLVDTRALLDALHEGRLAGCAMDVYENEGPLFFRDYTKVSSKERLKAWDRQFHELVALPNVLVTPHSAFLTAEALAAISATTVANLKACALGQPLVNEVKP